MVLQRKDEMGFYEYACGDCYSIVEAEDKFCWNCGATFNEDDDAYNRENFNKLLKQKK